MLAIDTCLSRLTLGLKTDTGEMVSVSEEIGVGHAERIAPALAGLLREAGAEASQLSRIGVTVGPGSFMGQRVGIAFAKGLAMASGAETVPLTTLEAFAEAGGGTGAVAIDARRGQVYCQLFRRGEAIADPQLVSYDEAAASLAGAARRLGNAGPALGLAFEGPDFIPPEALLFLTGKKTPAPLRTLYLRAPDAKPARALLP
nr:tRNA (adenosine(37)-N6)-threonylcarbamoyltransferase complex dimerization subunit type 1 TsaB [Parvularcula maris]